MIAVEAHATETVSRFLTQLCKVLRHKRRVYDKNIPGTWSRAFDARHMASVHACLLDSELKGSSPPLHRGLDTLED